MNGQNTWNKNIGLTWNSIGLFGYSYHTYVMRQYNIAYSPYAKVFVTINSNGAVCTSPDGKTWTTRGSVSRVHIGSLNGNYEDGFRNIAFLGNYMYVTGYNLGEDDYYQYIYRVSLVDSSVTTVYYATNDGSSHVDTGGASNGLSQIVLARSDLSTYRMKIYYSNNSGASFTKVQTSHAAVYHADVVYSPYLGRYVAFGSSGTSALYSSDGVEWTTVTISSSSGSYPNVIWFDRIKQFVATGVCSDYYLMSPDGITWTRYSFQTQTGNSSTYFYSSYKKIFCHKKRLFLLSQYERHHNYSYKGLYYSDDGITWTCVFYTVGAYSALPANSYYVTMRSIASNEKVMVSVSQDTYTVGDDDVWKYTYYYSK